MVPHCSETEPLVFMYRPRLGPEDNLPGGQQNVIDADPHPKQPEAGTEPAL